jgi:hypothetical protein
MEKLDALVQRALCNIHDTSTNQVYDSHVKSYFDFVDNHDIDRHPSSDTFSKYVAYMSEFVKPSTVKSYLSGIVYHLQAMYANARVACEDPLVKDTLTGCERLHGRPVIRKLPLCLSHIEHVTEQYTHSENIDNRLFVALLSTDFFGLLQLGELSDPDDQRKVNLKKRIKRESLDINTTSMSFTLPASKTDQFFAGNQILLRNCHSSTCPVSTVKRYILIRDTCYDKSPWLWLTSKGKPPMGAWFMKRFRKHFDKGYGSHPMRAGGATMLA